MHAFVTRFAPSPTGHLHLGHAFSALTAYHAARAANGRFVLRIEDIDQTRCRPAFEAAIYEDLAWLGLTWELPVRRQAEHVDEYAATLARLRADGLIYRCFKTRKEIADEVTRAPHLAPEGPEGPAYVGQPAPARDEHRLLDHGAPYAWRLSMDRALSSPKAQPARLRFTIEDEHGAQTIAANPAMFGDAILGRKDSGTSYHLAAVHDDALQEITHVIRGDDLAAAAHLHVLLQALLDLPTPIYRHHRLITGPDGKRLAKRDKAQTLQALRAAGVSPSEIRSRLGLGPG